MGGHHTYTEFVFVARVLHGAADTLSPESLESFCSTTKGAARRGCCCGQSCAQRLALHVAPVYTEHPHALSTRGPLLLDFLL